MSTLTCTGSHRGGCGGGSVTRACPILALRVECSRRDCEACQACYVERAAHVAHHRGLGVEPLSRAEAEALAREQLREALERERRGQLRLVG